MAQMALDLLCRWCYEDSLSTGITLLLSTATLMRHTEVADLLPQKALTLACATAPTGWRLGRSWLNVYARIPYCVYPCL